MSARLNMDAQRNISWKGQTFNQIVAGIKMNQNTFSANQISFCPRQLNIIVAKFQHVPPAQVPSETYLTNPIVSSPTRNLLQRKQHTRWISI